MAQIAAFADAHYKIAKFSDESATRTEIALLDSGGRIEELARIMGGETITELTSAAAEELLLNAKEIL